MALIISNLLKPRQAFDMVQMLNQILLTQPAVLTFREYLHNIDFDVSNLYYAFTWPSPVSDLQVSPQKDASLFEELYRAWCHNPVALLALCLLTQNYAHCRVLVKSMYASKCSLFALSSCSLINFMSFNIKVAIWRCR